MHHPDVGVKSGCAEGNLYQKISQKMEDIHKVIFTCTPSINRLYPGLCSRFFKSKKLAYMWVCEEL